MLFPLKVSFQQVPQLAEFQPPTAGAPPMLGKFLREPKVVNPFVSNPLVPSEHATVARDAPESSYALSHETDTLCPTAARERRARTVLKVNFIFEEELLVRVNEDGEERGDVNEGFLSESLLLTLLLVPHPLYLTVVAVLMCRSAGHERPTHMREDSANISGICILLLSLTLSCLRITIIAFSTSCSCHEARLNSETLRHNEYEEPPS